MAQTIQSLIAGSVSGVLHARYPESYHSLCHAHAIVGANVISVVFNRVYRPVAGLALIDGGSGLVRLTDNAAFAHAAGGAFHCWIESTGQSYRQTEVIDFSHRHSHIYARRNGLRWTRPLPPEYLWGARSRVLVHAELETMPASFDEGKVWMRETPEGADFLRHHIADNMNAYVVLTAEALQELQRRLPSNSRLLEPLMPARPHADEVETA
jgi:hypothetical protein